MSEFAWLRRNIRFLALYCLVVGFATSSAQAASSEIQQAEETLARGDCNSAWNIAWPLAKKGSQAARNFLYAAINGRMIPPGVTADHTSFYRHVLVLAAYAALPSPDEVANGVHPDRRFARHDVPASISGLKLGPSGERVAKCYRDSPSLKQCFDLAVSLRVIPTFAEYASETERRSNETGVAAHCLPPH